MKDRFDAGGSFGGLSSGPRLSKKQIVEPCAGALLKARKEEHWGRSPGSVSTMLTSFNALNGCDQK